MHDYERGRTPGDRARVVAEIHARQAADSRRTLEARHLPGGGEDVFSRCSFWERCTDAAEARWDEADRQWRIALADGGEFPDPGQGSLIAGLEAERAALWAERNRVKAHRDAALGELRGWDRPLHPGW